MTCQIVCSFEMYRLVNYLIVHKFVTQYDIYMIKSNNIEPIDLWIEDDKYISQIVSHL